jgi:hypothetical protein
MLPDNAGSPGTTPPSQKVAPPKGSCHQCDKRPDS